MIDKDEIKEIVEKSYLDEANIFLYLFENKKTKKDPLSIYNLNIDHNTVDLIKESSTEYMSSTLDSIQQIPLYTIPIYNPDNDQVIFRIDSQQVNMFQDIYKYLSGQSPCYPYKKDDVNEDKLKAWIFRAEINVNGGIEQILFFQRFLPSKMLKSKSSSIFETEEGFKLLEGNILSFNQTMDLLFYKNTFIVTRTSSFETIFGYEEYYKNNASELVKALNDNRIEGLAYSIQFIDINSVIIKINESTRLAHKFYSARMNGYFKKISYANLVDLDKRYKLGLNLDDTKNKWTIDEQSDLQKVASVLNDDYERSQLTNNEYIAIGKEILQTNITN